jgi:hypothetical protein
MMALPGMQGPDSERSGVMATETASATVEYPWEGKPRWVHMKLGRMSAAGGTFSGNPWHRLAGINRHGQDVAVCGTTWGAAATSKTDRPKADEPRCSTCEAAA